MIDDRHHLVFVGIAGKSKIVNRSAVKIPKNEGSVTSFIHVSPQITYVLRERLSSFAKNPKQIQERSLQIAKYYLLL